MSSGIPEHPGRRDKFRAWNANRTSKRTIKGDPQPWLAHEYVIDRAKWNNRAVVQKTPGRTGAPSARLPRRSARIAKRDAAVNRVTVESILSQEMDDLVCLICSDFADSGTCGPDCYLTWLRGPARRLNKVVEIRDTGTPMGYGAYVKPGRTIMKDRYIGEYLGELLPPDVGVGGPYVFEMEGVAHIDAEITGNLTRFFNHSCDPNIATWPAMIGGRRAIVFQAKRDIAADEQLFISYGKQYFANSQIQCTCTAVAGPHWP